jgi:aspartate carbamoyltransferase regulatory subunit
MEEKKLQVSAIKNGTVIDHVPADHLFMVINILGLHKIDKPITFGTNLESSRLGRKAIIKISDVYFEDEDINRIALVAPEAKLNDIRDYQVVNKRIVEVPDRIVGIAKCGNPKCITNHDNVLPKFEVANKKQVALKCHYCEKITDSEHMEIF